MRRPFNTEYSPPIMSAFREAFAARDARKRIVQTVSGERIVPGRHSSQRRGDEGALRRDLAIDLMALLNTIDLGSSVDLENYAHVRRSIVNYGLSDVGRLTSEEERVNLIRDDLRTALVQFEPRLNPETIHIERDEKVDDEQRVRFTVSVEMFCRPADLAVEFVAEVDVGSGKINLSRLPDTA
ncbi:type VI secretion system baseplate subunit TssE [Arvimicrobium flavum]|uniref:type VI secretion system baseplate subunit TssE n=1 Tax=Arvimicrobium flavum TaxID=3393320 RepID=UPI00237C027D|nr:type VI secretion system baseplate subunit TssE [Mesorhizobium shangrilense]